MFVLVVCIRVYGVVGVGRNDPLTSVPGVVKFCTSAALLPGKEPRYAFKGRQIGSQSRPGRLVEEQSLVSFWNRTSRPLLPERKLATTLTDIIRIQGATA